MRDIGISLPELTHKNFGNVRSYFEGNKDNLLSWAELKLVKVLKEYYHPDGTIMLKDIDGRTLAAAFRRFDIVERYIKSETWWDAS